MFDPHDHRADRRRQRGRHLDLEREPALRERHRDPAARRADRGGAPIMRAVHPLDAGDRAQLQIGQQVLPGQRRPEVELAFEAQRRRRATPDAARVQAIAGFEQRIEAAHAAEAGGEGNVGELERGFARASAWRAVTSASARAPPARRRAPLR